MPNKLLNLHWLSVDSESNFSYQKIMMMSYSKTEILSNLVLSK